MKLPLFGFALGLMLLLAGCASAPQKPANNTTAMSCNEYCMSQPHAQCVGDWKISGTYPNCVCNFECRTSPPPPPAPTATPPPPANNSTSPPPAPPNPPPANQTPPPPPPPPAAEHVIEVTAQQWHFEPGTITVKKGEKVKLLITSQDVTHGFSLPAFGISKTLNPGETVTVEFTPDKAGSFPFQCTVFCGSGHGGMRGTLIVEE